MQTNLTMEDVDTILVSLEYSKKNVSEARDTQPEVRKQNLAKIEAAMGKMREVKTHLKERR